MTIEARRVFLSHASPDKPMVRQIRDALRDMGHRPWLDEDEILPGESIPNKIQHGLRQADFILICLSRAAAQSGWVEAESHVSMMRQFKDRTSRILVARLEDVPPPDLLSHIAYVDLFPWDAMFRPGMDKLARRLAVPTASAPVSSAVSSEAASASSQPIARDLRARLVAGFSAAELEMLVADAFPEIPGGLDAIVAPTHPLELRAHRLVAYCKRRQWLARLEAALDEVRPT